MKFNISTLFNNFHNGFRSIFFLIIVVVFAGCGGGNGSSTPTGQVISIAAQLTGFEVVPAVNTNGIGDASISVNDQSGGITGSLQVLGLTGTPTVVHIHDGAAGTNGGILVTLEQDTTQPNTFNIPANTSLSSADLTKLLNSETYLQVHSNVHATGELRAQILAPNSDITRIETPLSGEEVSSPVATNGTGSGVILLNSNTGDIFGAMNVENLGGNPTAGHLHSGAPGSNGGILVAFDQNTNDANLFSIPANTTLNSSNLSTVLVSNSYLQVHSSTVTTGEVRGQVLPANSAFSRITTPLSGEEIAGGIVTDGTGKGVLLFNTTTNALFGAVTTRNLSSAATLGHIHNALPGVNGGVSITLDQDTNDTNIFSVPANTVLDATNSSNLLASETYFQIHSNNLPTGEVRGQILPEDSEYSRITTALTGLEVSPAVNTSGSGKSVLIVNNSTGDLSGAISLRNLAGTASAGHIHTGAAGDNGGVSLVYNQDGADTNLFSVPANTTLNSADLSSLLSSNTYLQVHSSAHTAGEVRGQALPQGSDILRLATSLSGSEVVPAVTTPATGESVILVNMTNGDLVGAASSLNLQGPGTAGHIHAGASGTNGGITVALDQDTQDTDLFQVPDNTSVTGDSLVELLNSHTYFQIHSSANATGELRGQILLSPSN